MKKSFKEIYSKILAESSEELEIERKKVKDIYIKVLTISIVVMLLWLIIAHSLNFMIIIIPLIVTFIIQSKNSKYRILFKDKVIKTFIKAYDENLNYIPTKGIDAYTYKQAEFERYDNYHSEDYIEGIIDNIYTIKMAEIHTEDEYTDSEGHKKTTTVFHGLFANIKSEKTFPSTITIHSDAGFLGNLFNKKNKLNMDSQEFEKQFDVHSENKIVAMQILTSDIMNLLLDFKEKYNIKFEITLKNTDIYIRFHTGNMFEPEVFKSSTERSTLEKYFNIINFTLDLSKLLSNTVKNTEI